MSQPHFAFLDHETPIAFAHRGGNAANDPENKENTMVAFASAYALGYDYLETDVILSADEQVVAIHGAKDERDAQKIGLPPRAVLQAKDYADIRHDHKIGGEEIPLLEEVLTTWPDVRVNIDPKTEEVARPLGRLIRRLDATDRVCITAFSEKRIVEAADELGGRQRVCTGMATTGYFALVGSGKLHLPTKHALKASEAACLQIPYNLNQMVPRLPITVNHRMVEVAHDAGKQLHVWTVNNRADMEAMQAIGVDGIMSDETAALSNMLGLELRASL